ncbi:MAG: hypothetical protein QOH03_804, partial [Kribbellaceae bacterium]|nr:hypothetical protein [Kribbellaceae bacterium]
VSAARELFSAGYRTPQQMRNASWRQRVQALGRGRYRRYDERTATMLGQTADLVLQRWNGDLRQLHAEAGDDPQRITPLLIEFKGIGPVGAQIFLREVQSVWPGICPYFDSRARQGAERVGLSSSTESLAALAPSPQEAAALAAALVRLRLNSRAGDSVVRAAGRGTGCPNGPSDHLRERH